MAIAGDDVLRIGDSARKLKSTVDQKIHSMAVIGGNDMNIVKSVFGAGLAEIRQHKRAYLAINVLYYGTVFAGMVVALLLPNVRDALFKAAGEAFMKGPLAPVGNAYGSGHFLLAVGLTFVVNLIGGSLLSINLPSAIIPFSGFLIATWRALLWGIVFSPGHHPLGAGLYVHFVTLLLEGQAYVLATLAAYVQGKAFLAPRTMDAPSHGAGYLLGLKHAGKLYGLITITLLIAALYEAFTGIYVVPALLPK